MKKTPIRTISTATTGKDILKLFRVKEKQFPELTITPPVGDIEITLFGIWKNLLHHHSFGVTKDFFKTVRNSLKGIQLVARICSHFSARFDLTDLFLHPTISQIASLINERQKEELLSPVISKYSRPGHIPLSFNQGRLWIISHLKDSLQYELPVVFRLKGNLNTALLNKVYRQGAPGTVIRQENDCILLDSDCQSFAGSLQEYRC